MRGKRGDIELQFNWIFVFVVGTLILALAAGFVITQKKNSDILISGQIIRFIRSVLTISSATPGKAEPQPLQKEIGVSCDPKGCSAQGCASDFYVKPRTLNAKIDTKIDAIFSPTTIKGQTLATWSMEWDMPYHVSNFLYTTSDQVRYIFVAGADPAYNALLDGLYSEMPDIMGQKEEVKVAEIDDIKDKNNYKVRLVFVNQGNEVPQMPAALKNMGVKDITAIQIIPDPAVVNLPEEDKRFSIGTIKFYQKSGLGFAEQTPKYEVYYLGKPTVFGAIFSESREMYECNMYKALLRQQVVSQLYILKIDSLLKASTDITNQACLVLYGTAQGYIQALADPTLTLVNAPIIKENSDKISAANNEFKLKSCPQIY